MNKNLNKTQESGRSMVEMLGVLAVIGVLSIAGVAGYTTAMNKHRANEILNAASVRAVMVSTKLQKGSTVDITKALAEFGSEAVQGVTFGEPAKVGDNQFKIPLSGTGLTTEICSQMKNIVGEDGIVNISDDCTTLTYNNDLSAGVTPAPSDPLCASVTCESGKECSAGVCVPKANPSDNSCAKNDDCKDKTMCAGKTCYCAISATMTGSGPTCSYTGHTGTCAVVSEGTAPTGTSYKVSSGGMTWWSAVNFCKAVKTGGQLVSLEDIGCDGDGTTPSYNLTGSGYPVYFWTTDAADCDESWTCTIGTNNNSCYAFGVGTNSGYVTFFSRDDSDYALCK